MKKLLISLILFLCVQCAFAVGRYIGYYKTMLAYGGDTIESIAPKFELMTKNKKIKISVQYEIVTSSKSAAVKMANVATAFSGLGGNFTQMRMAALQTSDIGTMNISVLVENVSDDEISVNDRNAGTMFYILPGESIVMNRENLADVAMRIEYADKSKDYLDLYTSAKCLRVERMCKTDDFWIVKEKLDDSPYLDCVKGRADFSDYIQFPEKIFYVRIDTKTFNYEPVRLDQVNAEIKQAKAKNKDMDNDNE